MSRRHIPEPPFELRQSRELEDAILAEHAAKGDCDAFDRLVSKYVGRAYAAAFEWCRDRRDVPDVVGEALMRAYRAIGSFRGDSSFSTWLHRIVVNCAHDANRGLQSRKECAFDEQIGVELDRRMLRLSDTDEEEIRDAKWKRVAGAIERLKPEKRELVVRSHVRRVPYAVLADELGVAVGTVKSRLHRVREELRTKVVPM